MLDEHIHYSPIGLYGRIQLLGQLKFVQSKDFYSFLLWDWPNFTFYCAMIIIIIIILHVAFLLYGRDRVRCVMFGDRIKCKLATLALMCLCVSRLICCERCFDGLSKWSPMCVCESNKMWLSLPIVCAKFEPLHFFLFWSENMPIFKSLMANKMVGCHLSSFDLFSPSPVLSLSPSLYDRIWWDDWKRIWCLNDLPLLYDHHRVLL